MNMNAETVRELGEQIVYEPNIKLLGGKICLIIFLLVVGITLSVLINKYITDSDIVGILCFIMVVSILYLGMYNSIKILAKSENEYEGKIQKWKMEIVEPYIRSLPTEKKEIASIEIDQTEPGYKTIYKNDAYQSNKEEIRLFVITYEDNGKLVTDKKHYKIMRTLTEDEKPYIEFKRLKESLGYDINPGTYEEKLYIPKTYQWDKAVE